MKRSFHLAAAALAASVLLAACGGGGDSDIVFEDDDPTQSEQSGSVLVAGSGTAVRNGTYASRAVFLNDVEKFNPVGSAPELCRYRFSRLDQTGTDADMEGDIRYQPGTNTVREMFVRIYDVDYSLSEPTGASVNRALDRVDFTGASLRNDRGDTITLTGSIPMRDDRPEGC